MDPAFKAPHSLNVVTYNCLGLKYISHYRKERLAEIGHQLAIANPVPEIVGLQECWTQEDYASITEQTKHILPYAKYYYSGVFGGGLAILSKWPIEESSMVRYPLNGRPTAFFRGDWFVGKGVACARIRLGPKPKDIAEVFCTHLHAPYEREPNDSYICHRTAQAWEIAKLMRGAAERGHLVLGLGDFNMLPLSFAHQLITTHAPVRDAWRVLHPDSSIGPANSTIEKQRGRPIPNASFNLTENGAASDGVLNTWRWPKEQQKRLFKGEKIIIDERSADPKAKRLDYVFIGSVDGSSASRWQVQSIKVGMTERHPTIGCSLSDHFSIEATLKRSEAPDTGQVYGCTEQTSLSDATYETILSMISIYTSRELRQRRLRLGHFGLSILISTGCIVAVWWSPDNFVAFILTLLSTLGFGAGVVDGLIGGLFVGSELRALKEFEWEIQIAKYMANERKNRHGNVDAVSKELTQMQS
ncbi:Sphingomyelin phosphodiesterase 2, neutral membrane (Neutral sphingomyelinase) [Puttea exsequens]|nr:Sphingomyelin phosphodiesterase 2, neutral membrane (Neutral sphingomyelinase) [Puttea exsequens]